ncbi:hypothetical protein ACC715_36980, partial [Rhizobium ruizarguesonis]
NISVYNTNFTERLNNITQYFLSKGGSVFDAQKKALVVINNGVDKQSFLLSYLDAYLFIGLLFLLAMPLLLLVIKRRKQSAPAVI